MSLGPSYGYLANPSKTWLIVKPKHLPEATKVFHDSGINITTEAKRHLGAALGGKSFVDSYVEEKVAMRVKEVEDLAIIAKSHPQAAYAAFTHGLTSKWTYLMRTVSVAQQCLQPLEDAIRQQLLPALTGKTDISDIERELISLPARLGGLSIPNPTVTPPTEHNASLEVTAPLVEAICEQHGEYNVDTMAQQQQCKVKVKSKKRSAQMAASNSLHPQLPQKLQKLMEVAKEKSSSSWLVALPIESHGFSLHKGAFWDVFCLRYGWQPPLLPTTCACGKSFTTDHTLNCPTGGSPLSDTMRFEISQQTSCRRCATMCVWSPPSNPSLVSSSPMPPLTGKTQLA